MMKTAGEYLKNIVACTIVLALVWYLYHNWSVFTDLLDASRYRISMLVVLSCISLLLNGIQSQILLSVLGVKIRFWENQALVLGATLANYAPFRAGTVIRMTYLKRMYGLEYPCFGALAMLRLATMLSGSTLAGGIGLAMLWIQGRNPPASLTLVLGSAFVASSAALMIRPAVTHPENKGWRRWWNLFAGGYRELQSRPRALWLLLVLVCLQCVSFSLRLFIAYDAIGVTISRWSALVMAPSVMILSFATISPGNLGLREWVLGLFSDAAGYEFRAGIFAGTMDRAVVLGCTLLLGGASLIYIWLKTSRSVENVGHSIVSGNQSADTGQTGGEVSGDAQISLDGNL